MVLLDVAIGQAVILAFGVLPLKPNHLVSTAVKVKL